MKIARPPLILAGLLLIPAGALRADPPATLPGPRTVWGQSAKVAANGADVAIPFESDDLAKIAAFGAPGCPMALIGKAVWNLEKKAPTGISIPYDYSRHPLSAISDPGHLLALARNANYAAEGDTNAEDIGVWDLSTGKKLLSIPAAQRDRNIDFIAFAGEQRLLVAGASRDETKPMMEVWNVKTGKLNHQFECNFVSPLTATVSSDGFYVALADADNLNVYEIATGHVVLTIMPPTMGAIRSFPFGGFGGRRFFYRIRTGPWNGLGGLAFSPDGTLLAGLIDTYPQQQFICWDNSGHVIKTTFLHESTQREDSLSPVIQWSPDSSFCLVDNAALLDPKSEALLYLAPTRPDGWAIAHLVSAHELLLSTGDATEIIPLPITTIHKALSALADPAVKAFGTGRKVAVQVNLLHCAGDSAATRKAMEPAINTRLASAGVTLAPTAAMTIDFTVEERRCPPTPITREIVGSVDGAPTGRMATRIQSLLTITIHATGSATPLYAWNAADCPGAMQAAGSITQQMLDAQAIDSVVREIGAAPMPTFVSAADPAVHLPLGAPAFNLQAAIDLFKSSDSMRRSLVEMVPQKPMAR